MPRGRRAYPFQFRQRIVELVRVGRRPGELAREFEPTVESINRWVKQADRDEGRLADGFTTQEREEMRRGKLLVELRREGILGSDRQEAVYEATEIRVAALVELLVLHPLDHHGRRSSSIR